MWEALCRFDALWICVNSTASDNPILFDITNWEHNPNQLYSVVSPTTFNGSYSRKVCLGLHSVFIVVLEANLFWKYWRGSGCQQKASLNDQQREKTVLLAVEQCNLSTGRKSTVGPSRLLQFWTNQKAKIERKFNLHMNTKLFCCLYKNC